MRRHPWIVILIWFLAGMALAALATAKSAKVTETDPAAFLPKSSESARAVAFGREAFGQVKGATTVTVLVKPRDGGKLDPADLRATETVAQQLRGWHEAHGSVVATQAGGEAPDGRFALVGVKFKGSTTDPLAQRASSTSAPTPPARSRSTTSAPATPAASPRSSTSTSPASPRGHWSR